MRPSQYGSWLVAWNLRHQVHLGGAGARRATRSCFVSRHVDDLVRRALGGYLNDLFLLGRDDVDCDLFLVSSRLERAFLREQFMPISETKAEDKDNKEHRKYRDNKSDRLWAGVESSWLQRSAVFGFTRRNTLLELLWTAARIAVFATRASGANYFRFDPESIAWTVKRGRAITQRHALLAMKAVLICLAWYAYKAHCKATLLLNAGFEDLSLSRFLILVLKHPLLTPSFLFYSLLLKAPS